MFEQEIWKDLKGYEGLYQVSNLGRIKSLYFSKEKIMKPIFTCPQNNGCGCNGYATNII